MTSHQRQPLLSDWLSLQPNGKVVVRVGKVELGQGIRTALAQIAAEELDVGLARIEMARPATGVSPDEGFTSGSRSIMDSGSILRDVCAQARRVLLEAAAKEVGRDAALFRVDDGAIVGAEGDCVATYWTLARDGLLDRPLASGVGHKPRHQYGVVGQSVPRIDLQDKLNGRGLFAHDVSEKGQLYGRVVRPPAPGARLISFDARTAEEVPFVTGVVHEGSFLGVVAEREEIAIHTAELLHSSAVWTNGTPLPDVNDLNSYLTTQPSEEIPIAHRSNPLAADRVSYRQQWSFSRPYLAHASIGPGSASARWEAERIMVWTHSQGIYPLRDAIAVALNVPKERVVVRHMDGPGCYGHNSADDVAFDAVLLARGFPGRLVRVVWSRDDEFAWEPYGPAMVATISAGVDRNGDLVQWRHDVWSNGHSCRPGYNGHGLLAGWHMSNAQPPAATDPPLSGGAGIARNAIPAYDTADLEVEAHRVLDMPLRTSSLRSLGAALNVFAIESVIDELALRANVDPVKYRQRHLMDPRARTVLHAAATRARWDEPRAEGTGVGVGYARYKNSAAYCSAVARIDVSSRIRVSELVVAVDAGLVINPDGLANQIEGGAIQALSWTLHECVQFNKAQVTSRDWDSYPIVRFSEVPTIQVIVISNDEEPSLGVGECALGPVTAAIGNALANGIGLRVCELPLTQARLEAAAALG